MNVEHVGSETELAEADEVVARFEAASDDEPSFIFDEIIHYVSNLWTIPQEEIEKIAYGDPEALKEEIAQMVVDYQSLRTGLAEIIAINKDMIQNDAREAELAAVLAQKTNAVNEQLYVRAQLEAALAQAQKQELARLAAENKSILAHNEAILAQFEEMKKCVLLTQNKAILSRFEEMKAVQPKMAIRSSIKMYIKKKLEKIRSY